MSFGNYDDMLYFQRCEEAGPEGVPPPALSWTASETEGWTEEDYEAAGLAMDRNMRERDEWWRHRAEQLEEENRELRSQLGLKE